MSVATAQVLSLAPASEIAAPVFRLSVNQYHAMIDAGILTENDPVELLEGYLVTKMPKNPPHVSITGFILDALFKLLPQGWHLRSQDPITLIDSEPEPYIAVIRGTRRDYLNRHPQPSDIAIVIEVAHSTLLIDRTWKKRLYAGAGIPVYWIVNLQDSVIEVYTEPNGTNATADYHEQSSYTLGDSMPVTLDGSIIGNLSVTDLLP